MTFRIFHLLFFLLWIVQLDCEVYNDRPKIIASNGDLVLEPAYGKNIYIRLHGPKSTVFIGDQDFTSIPKESNAMQNNNANPKDLKFSQNDDGKLHELQRRIEKLESQTSSWPIETFLNISILSRRINTLSNRVRTLQSRLNSRSTDECQSHPCENGGTCLNLANGYYCLCPSTWKGKNCDEDVNECRNYAGTDLGCQNGARCINKPGSYECICKPNWYGLDCTKKAKDCSGGDYEMCGHGSCIPVTSGQGIKCICEQGWTTNGTDDTCLTDVNECETGQGARCSVNPKVKCINLPGSYKCEQCPIGYEGDGYTCYDIDECMTIPNGGCSTTPMVSCHNTIGSRICGSCPPGYQGDGVSCTWRGTCSINHGGCHPSAQCVESPGLSRQMVQCICPYGMIGDGIGMHGCYVEAKNNLTQSCDDNPCGPHGQCLSLRSGYTCICYNGYSGMHCDRSGDNCASNPCYNGGTCRPDKSVTRGFRCECTALHSGDLCQLNSQPCGGVLNAEEGSIIYPLSNKTYIHNSRCAWVIHTSPDKVINVTFSKFNLEYDSECRNDFVQIHDGRSSASQLIGRFCGNNFPKGGNIVSSHNNLYFWFRSDQTIAKDGFALHWVSVPPQCGGEINASTHGHLSSPGSPGTYPPNRDCYWHLTTSLGKRIQIHFFQLDIEVHPNCSYDYIAIYDGEHTSDPLIGKYCNSSQPPPVESASSEILIHFHSDEYGSGHGFQIAYAPKEGVPGCGGLFTTDKGEITSPSYNGSYLNNLLCEYKIKTRHYMKLRVEFTNFNLERSFKCKYDFLKVYDGSSSDSRLIGNFCGNSLPNSFVSSSDTIFIIFKSDQSMSSEGFKIKYESVCSKEVIGDSGIINSPGYPIVYPRNTACEYIIRTTPGKAIQLTFQDFDIEDNRYYDCQYDNVEVRDGHSANSTLLGRFCGGSEHTPPMQTSSYNFMYIKFNSDLSVTGRGFYANFTTVDIECGGVYKDNNGVVNHPKLALRYNNDQKCTWLIIAPIGKHIKLTWNRFNLETMPSCMSDYVQLIEFDDNNDNSTLGKYCGEKLPPALTTSSNSLMIKFVSDASIPSAGFSLSYSFLDEETHCDRLYVKTHGIIYSPNWPNLYPPNRDCTWVITVPIGQQVLLNVSEFDLERPIRGKCDLGDYLTLRDGANDNSPIIGKYCGNFKSKRILSTSNSIHLQFHSDFYLAGKGFKIEWDGSITGCGGTLNGIKGSLSSPNYPQDYNENAECFYRIVTSSGSRLKLSFINLDLERTTNCRDDYVEIFDGRDSNSHSYGKHCFLTNDTKHIETSTNFAFLIFRSDIFLTAKGFLLNYDTICNNNVTGRYGVIESPGFPGNYALNMNCLWTITVPKGNIINITFTHFELFTLNRHLYHPWSSSAHSLLRITSPQCEHDNIQYKETSSPTYSKKLCGSTIPDPISSASNSMQIKFSSGSYFSKTGFRLEWVSYGCGGHIQKRSGDIKLEQIKDLQSEIECEWLIETPFGTAASITVTNLLITENKNCTIDAIEIYNGQSTDYPLLTRVCHRGTTVARSSSNVILVKLVKQSSLRDIYFEASFNSFKASCGGNIEAKSGFIYSKNYPQNYENNLDCSWLITVPKNHKIEINFIDFDLYSEDNEDDCSDSVRIYDGGKIISNNNYSREICPKSNNTRFISNHSLLLIQFITNSYGTAKGFKAEFKMICGAVINADNDGVISNYNSPTHENSSCTWTIVAQTSSKIKLTVQHLNLPRNTDIATNKHCPSSFLRVFDGINDKAPLIDEFCGRKVPSTIVSRGSALTIELGTYIDVIIGQFEAHYSTVTTACGGSLSSEEGDIASLNYPQSYPINSNCEWILSTSPGNRVYVTFEDFDLDYSESCNEDYLEIREDNGGGKLLAVYCGHDVPANMTTGTKLYIKFHSDHIKTGRGFLLHYGFLHGNDITGLNSGEVTSPLFPHLYENQGEYTWRITVSGMKTITLSIDNLEIQRTGDSCNNKLVLYDGFDEDAPILKEMCGILKNDKTSFQTASSVVFIKFLLDETNKGSLFHIKWVESERNIENSNGINKANCGTNFTQSVLHTQDVTIQSPNYPQEYGYDQNCVWIFHSETGRHLSLRFKEILLEETSNCFADYISIYSSDNQIQWTPVAENICLSINKSQKYESSKFMKVFFKSDSSVVRKGFQAIISSECGGTVLETSGLIEGTFDLRTVGTRICDWIIKVRPGRTIRTSFEHFNITNTDTCNAYVMLKNGGSNESPLLGKYCGHSGENKTNILSSGNMIFVRYFRKYMLPYAFQSFRLRYEEMNIGCGTSSKLDIDHSWEIISSPNYPSVPVPFTECVWVFSGPPGEILRVDFIERFDLETSDDCEKELVELRDGSTRLSPLKGTFCKERPSTVKSSRNTIFIRYSTQISEPRNGFKANISIDVCGGTVINDSGEIVSPNYPHMSALPTGSVCQWQIISSPRHIIKINMMDINFPESDTPCGTKIAFEETIPSNGSREIAKIKEFCNDEYEDYTEPFESITNNVTVKLYIGTPSQWSQLAESRGFKLKFDSSRPSCGGTIRTSEGFVTTPGYPRETSIRFCQWIIIAPDTSRRVRLEILDMTDEHSLAVYNDNTFSSVIDAHFDETNTSEKARIFESTGNKLSFYIWIKSSNKISHRFKAQFSSYEAALCGGSLNGLTGELRSPNIQQSYVCEWQFRNIPVVAENKTTYLYNSIYVTINISSLATSRFFCRYSSSRLNFNADIVDGNTFVRNVCGNKTQVFYSVPISIMNVKAIQYKRDPLFFNIKWKLQPCGGVVYASSDLTDILKIPEHLNEAIYCSWVLISPRNERIELKIEGSFNLDCSDEFIKISLGISQSSIVVANYCKNTIPEKPFSSSFTYTYIQYQSKPQNGTNIKLLMKTSDAVCGGYLTHNLRTFSSPKYPQNYPINIECTWEIESDLGYKIYLQFEGRFAIEDTANCTKDVLIIYDWQNKAYHEQARLCGRNLPQSINSTFNKMKIVFRSDSTNTLDGFKAKWSPTCGGKFIANDKEDMLYSPGYNYAYHPSLFCEYEISAPSNKVNLKFLSFELEGTYPDCKYDNLTITANNDFNYLENTYCGTETPPPLDAFETVKLRFMTDRFGQKRGFKLSYSVYSCGGKITEPRLLTMEISDSYGNQRNCTWTIETSDNKIVVLTFLYIDVESNYECYSDNVEVYDGSYMNPDKRLARLCGHINTTTTIRSNTNKALLQFTSEAYYNSKGFKVNVMFSLSRSSGCGGDVILNNTSKRILKSPLLGDSTVYESYLDCYWNIKAPVGNVVKISFNSFHIATCLNVNQTALGHSQCDCDFVEILDGLNPNSLIIGKYCGHTMPPDLISSDNVMGIRLSTDGDLWSSGFEVSISFQPSPCGKTVFKVSRSIQRLKSPGYDISALPRGLHCSYYFDSSLEPYSTVHVSIKELDIEADEKCRSDKLIIYSTANTENSTIGKYFVWNDDESNLLTYAHFYDSILRFPKKIINCVSQKSLDYYLSGSINLNLITSPEGNPTHKGVEIEVSFLNFCSRNYSENQGRIQSSISYEGEITTDCNVLISAPENYTISAYFMSVSPTPWNNNVYLEIFDGNSTSAPSIVKIENEYIENNPIFSNGPYLLLHNHRHETDAVGFDLNYVITDKGRGCGGKLSNILGRVTSPLYPNTYRRKATCEWELETPADTFLRLHFTVFDLGIVCDQNHLSLIDKKGNTISTFCSEKPADYTSVDNYIKIVFVTTFNNGGTGWIADFAGTLKD